MMTKKDRIVALHQKGLRHKQIAAQLTCCPHYVSAALQRHRLGRSRPCDLAAARRRTARDTAARRAARRMARAA